MPIPNYTRLCAIALRNAGYTYREIEAELGVSKAYANYVFNRYSKAREQLIACDPEDKETRRELTKQIVGDPTRTICRNPYKIKDDLRECLMDMVDFEKQKKEDLGKTHKQSLRSTQIADLVRSMGYDVSDATVRRFMKEQMREPPEAFIPQFYEPGRRFEFDYGKVRLKIAGKVRTYKLAVAAAPASEICFARLYENEQMDSFIDCHIAFFEYMGGTFREGVYDNMGQVVSHFSKMPHKQFTKEVVKLACYYGFSINANNIASGNEKSAAERSVKRLRLLAFAPKYEFESLEDARRHLENVIAKTNSTEALAFERTGLRPLPPRYERRQGNPYRIVNSNCLITVGNAEYSVPEHLVGEKVEVALYDDDVEAFYKGEKILVSRRIEEKATLWEIRHVLKTLQRKPGSLRYSQVLRSHPLLKAVFDEFYIENPKEFIKILTENAAQNDGTVAVKLIQEAMAADSAADTVHRFRKQLQRGKSDYAPIEEPRVGAENNSLDCPKSEGGVQNEM